MERITWPASLINSLQFSNGHGLGGWLAIILVGSLVAQEYRWRTFHLSVSRGIPRKALLISKFMAVLFSLSMIVLSILASGGLVTAWFTKHLNPETASLGASILMPVAQSAFRTFYTMLPYAALAFYLAVLFRSAIVAISAGLAYTLILERIFTQLLNAEGGWFADAAAFLPVGLATSLIAQNRASLQISANFVDAATGSHNISPNVALIGITLYKIILVCASLWTFQRQDLHEQTTT